MAFAIEKDFEEALISVLTTKGWEDKILYNYTEKQLIENWANILFENNRNIDRLDNHPLTSGEMLQIMEQITTLKTPLKLNGFINGGSVTIKRDNQDDKRHFGKEISLKIYDRKEIAAGQSRYQIVRQPIFPTPNPIHNNRRGDLMLLINGMPVIHIELKSSNESVNKAANQIKKYSDEKVFTGLFSLVQVFVAMNPEETLYFANPGPDGTFNPRFYFHWADFNNNPINDWKKIASTLLSIPMAHQLIGFYTVADTLDGVLKVMRSYQYYAANAISDKVTTTKWEKENQRGGYIWHTTGSGKTMTSFKSAQLIASSKDADKVIFLMDRIELGTQSLIEYRHFANDDITVEGTENTGVLIKKLKSPDPSDTLIVSSIQKMSNIKKDDLSAEDMRIMNSKRIVFIIDECHRSTFGDMLYTIKETFPNAIFFGFTGTPIQEENQKKMSRTDTVFGNELHRYSIADGIRDKNVLGFDPYKVLTFKDEDLKMAVALEKAKAKSLDEVYKDKKKEDVFYKYYNLEMTGHVDKESGNYIKGIEDYIDDSQYRTAAHQNTVVSDIVSSFRTLSWGKRYNAIFATSSIPEAIEYYRLLKKAAPDLKISALFDPNIDNNGNSAFKEDGLCEIIKDYHIMYGTPYTIASFGAMKSDISLRLAHKKQYEHIDRTPELQLDLLVVVDQMLTGYDSKWTNTLYLDKMLKYENIIQAFSRTNRIFDEHKKFGIIRYYRRPHTMEKNIEAAVRLYSGDKPYGLFVDKLDRNIESMNNSYKEILNIFADANIENFIRLPDDDTSKKKFASLFKKLTDHLDAAKLQGFSWKDTKRLEERGLFILFDEKTYQILLLRYKELSTNPRGVPGPVEDVPYDIDGYLMSISTEDIDNEYMNARFARYVKLLERSKDNPNLQKAESELHRTFATLSQEDQKYADVFLHDIQRGDVQPIEGKTLRDYITEYKNRAKNDQIHKFAEQFGFDEEKLRRLMDQYIPGKSINTFGQYEEIKNTFVKEKAAEYFSRIEGKKIIPPKVSIKMDTLLRQFITSGGFDIEEFEKR